MASSRRLSWIALLLPVGSLVAMFVVFALVQASRNVAPRGLRTSLALGSVGAVPLAIVASLVLAIVAMVKARRERAAAVPRATRVLPVVAVFSSMASAGLFALVIYLAMRGLAAFR